MDFPEKLAAILITQEQLRSKVLELGAEITNDFKGKDLTVIGLLKGSAIFTADLVRAIELPIILDFMSISSYGGSINSPTGVGKILKELGNEIEGRAVFVSD